MCVPSKCGIHVSQRSTKLMIFSNKTIYVNFRVITLYYYTVGLFFNVGGPLKDDVEYNLGEWCKTYCLFN